MSMFIFIMLFYAVLAFVIGPIIGYYFGGKTYQSAGRGFVLFSIINIVLWRFYGEKMV